MTRSQRLNTTRRQIMKTGIAASATMAMPRLVLAQAKWTRKNVNAPEAAIDLEVYRAAVAEMLRLPPDDPRNWYRQAILHLIDCPHGNWWFFNWHRPFVGYFEQICREVTGQDDFALPYWDWSSDPALPDRFWNAPSEPQNILDPTSEHYFANADVFLTEFDTALDAFWGGLTQPQKAALRRRRNLDSLAKLKSRIHAAYSPRASARDPEAQMGQLQDYARDAVEPGTITGGLAPDRFETRGSGPFGIVNAFNSAVVENHSAAGDYAIIEGQPHNLVHGSIGGQMGRFLSPVDPIFWMHHCNIDRLWVVWSALQAQRGKSDKPSAAEANLFNTEPYLFFVDGTGAPVTANTTAGDYMDTARFDYDYTPGTGSQIVPSAAPRTSASMRGTVLRAQAEGGRLPTASFDLTEALAPLADSGSGPQIGYATIRFVPVAGLIDAIYNLFLTIEGESVDLSLDGADYAGSFAFFGMAADAEPTTVTISITNWLERNKGFDGSLTGTFSVGGLGAPEEPVEGADTLVLSEIVLTIS